MKFVLLASLFICSLPGASFAQVFNLRCKAIYNSEVILDRDVALQYKQRNLNIGGKEPFQFILSSAPDGKVEFQAYNSWDPSRSYASALMSGRGAFVELSIWKREYLLEARCVLLN